MLPLCRNKDWDLEATYAELDGLTPILYAAKIGDDAFIQDKLGPLNDDSKRAYLSCQNKGGLTPLHFACKYGQIAVIEVLFSLEAPANMPSKLGHYPIHSLFNNSAATATTSKDIMSMFNSFITHDVDITVRTRDGANIAHYAAREGVLALLTYIASHHPKLLAQTNNRGLTPCAVAALHLQQGAVGFLEALDDSAANEHELRLCS